MTKRQCGGCTLCCKLLPMQQGRDLKHPEMLILFGVPGMVREFDKPAGARCPYQRSGRGCTCYDKRPLGCRVWSCRWLTGDDTAAISRPDRARYVIDSVPDFIRLKAETEEITLQVVQIWVDPGFPHVWRLDPNLRAFIERRAAEGIGALIRINNKDAIGVFAPPLASDGQWHYVADGNLVEERTTWPGQTPKPVHP